MKKRIRELLQKRNAILLAHNYQPPDIQDVADICGDSLELSIKAAQTDAEVIVFCGVHFMAETASILCPDKTVLLPVQDAGCPMADMITAQDLACELSKHPGLTVVTYVNSSAAVKALSTVCCTSANVLRVLESLGDTDILMTPDRNLARYAACHTGRRVRWWQGFCPYHDSLSVDDVLRVRAEHPDAVFMAHPECRLEVLEMADVVLSTSGMLKHVGQSKTTKFIVGTEEGILYPLQKANPDKAFIPGSSRMRCRDMKKIGLKDVIESLEHMRGVVKVPEEIRKPAHRAVQRMIEL